MEYKEYGAGVAENTVILKSAMEKLAKIVEEDQRQDKQWKYAMDVYNKHKKEGKPVAAEPPHREPVRLYPASMMAIRASMAFINMQLRLQEIITDDEKAMETFRMLSKLEKKADEKSEVLYAELKGLLLRTAIMPPEIHMQNEKMVAFSCPVCNSHTILAYGTEFYHCPKCGQRLKDYESGGLFGNAVATDAIEFLDTAAKKMDEDARLYENIKDRWKVGETYHLIIELPEKTTSAGTTFEKKKKDCRLLAKYPRYALFEYEGKGGYPLKISINYQDIRLAR